MNLPKITDEMRTLQEDRILRAKIASQKEKPFFYFLFSRLNIKEICDEKICPTMFVNSMGDMGYNPAFLSKLSLPELTGVMFHEVMHVAFLHLLRLGGRDHNAWNTAVDIVANQILLASKVVLPPQGWVPREDGENWKIYVPFKIEPEKKEGEEEKKETELPENWASLSDSQQEKLYPDGFWLKQLNKKGGEVVYDEILSKISQRQKKGGQGKRVTLVMPSMSDGHQYGKGNPGDQEGDGKGSGRKGDNLPGQLGEGLTEEDEQKIAKKWKQALTEAATIAKVQGHLPGIIESMIQEVLETKTSWKDRLTKFVTQELFTDFTWARPNKKSLSSGFYMPSYIKEKLQVVFCFDTSGSISDHELQLYLGEAQAIARAYENIEALAIVCDCEIHGIHELDSCEAKDISSNVKMKGRGGTSHLPIEEYLRKEKPDTKLVICFTDLYTDIPQERTGTWLWVVAAGSAKDQHPELDPNTIIEIEE